MSRNVHNGTSKYCRIRLCVTFGNDTEEKKCFATRCVGRSQQMTLKKVLANDVKKKCDLAVFLVSKFLINQ